MTNGEKYPTAKERAEAFAKHCVMSWKPPLEEIFGWLDLEVPVEQPLPCPFCGTRCYTPHEGDAYYVECPECCYRSGGAESLDKTIAAHNALARSKATCADPQPVRPADPVMSLPEDLRLLCPKCKHYCTEVNGQGAFVHCHAGLVVGNFNCKGFEDKTAKEIRPLAEQISSLTKVVNNNTELLRDLFDHVGDIRARRIAIDRQIEENNNTLKEL